MGLRDINQFVEETGRDKNNKTSLISEKDFNSIQKMEKRFKCDCCDQRFYHRGHLNNHLKIHTGEKPFQCDYCGKKFTKNSDLNRHIKIHTGEKPFKCDFCAKKFTEKGNLNTHLKIHTGEKSFKCEFCEKKFTTSDNLSSHIRTHSGEKAFKCELCQESFSKEELRKAHFEKNHWLDEKLRKCFSTNSDARTKKSVQEEIGNKTDSIRVQSELVSDPKEKEHDATGDNETVPAKIKVSGQAEAAKKFVELSTREDGVWKCRVCGYSTNRGKGALHSHMETHFDGLEYPCLHCSKVLATKNNYNAHKYQNHRDVMIIDDTSMDGAETRKSTGTSLGLGVDADAKMETKLQFMKGKHCNAQSANIRHLGKATLLLTRDLYIWDKRSNVQSVIFSLLRKGVLLLIRNLYTWAKNSNVQSVIFSLLRKVV